MLVKLRINISCIFRNCLRRRATNFTNLLSQESLTIRTAPIVTSITVIIFQGWRVGRRVGRRFKAFRVISVIKTSICLYKLFKMIWSRTSTYIIIAVATKIPFFSHVEVKLRYNTSKQFQYSQTHNAARNGNEASDVSCDAFPPMKWLK